MNPQTIVYRDEGASIELLRELGVAFLFLMAGYEIDVNELRGSGGRHAMAAWAGSLGLAFASVAVVGVSGGVFSANGIAIAIALKSGASTAGTDFIALYVSNKTGKTIWPYVFAGNCCVLGIFGAIFGWEHAAYSIVFQFISTKAIDGFYHRYNRSTLIITTKRPKEVADAYTKTFHHGASIIDGTGAYSGDAVGIIHTVLSSYEVGDAIKAVRAIDPRAVINVLKTDDFVGNFHRAGIDEPLPSEVLSTPEVDPVLHLVDRMHEKAENQ